MRFFDGDDCDCGSSTMSGLVTLRIFGIILMVLGISAIGIDITAFLLVQNVHAGSWWAGIGVVVTGIFAVASVVRVVLVCCLVLSLVASIISIVGTCIDGIAFGAVNNIKGCASGPNTYASTISGVGITYYGDSAYNRAALGCYTSSYSGGFSCYCVNENVAPFTCYLYQGPSNCDEIFGKYRKLLLASTIMNAASVVVLIALTVVVSLAICWPQVYQKKADFALNEDKTEEAEAHVRISHDPVPMRFQPSPFNAYKSLKKRPPGARKSPNARGSDDGSLTDEIATDAEGNPVTLRWPLGAAYSPPGGTLHPSDNNESPFALEPNSESESDAEGGWGLGGPSRRFGQAGQGADLDYSTGLREQAEMELRLGSEWAAESKKSARSAALESGRSARSAALESGRSARSAALESGRSARSAALESGRSARSATLESGRPGRSPGSGERTKGNNSQMGEERVRGARPSSPEVLVGADGDQKYKGVGVSPPRLHVNPAYVTPQWSAMGLDRSKYRSKDEYDGLDQEDHYVDDDNDGFDQVAGAIRTSGRSRVRAENKTASGSRGLGQQGYKSVGESRSREQRNRSPEGPGGSGGSGKDSSALRQLRGRSQSPPWMAQKMERQFEEEYVETADSFSISNRQNQSPLSPLRTDVPVLDGSQILLTPVFEGVEKHLAAQQEQGVRMQTSPPVSRAASPQACSSAAAADLGSAFHSGNGYRGVSNNTERHNTIFSPLSTAGTDLGIISNRQNQSPLSPRRTDVPVLDGSQILLTPVDEGVEKHLAVQQEQGVRLPTSLGASPNVATPPGYKLNFSVPATARRPLGVVQRRNGAGGGASGVAGGIAGGGGVSVAGGGSIGVIPGTKPGSSPWGGVAAARDGSSVGAGRGLYVLSAPSSSAVPTFTPRSKLNLGVGVGSHGAVGAAIGRKGGAGGVTSGRSSASIGGKARDRQDNPDDGRTAQL